MKKPPKQPERRESSKDKKNFQAMGSMMQKKVTKQRGK